MSTFGRNVLVKLIYLLANIFYDIHFKYSQIENIRKYYKDSGGVIICNHVSYIDAIIITSQLQIPIRFLSHIKFKNTFPLGTLLRSANVIFVDPDKPKEALKTAITCAQQGALIGIFPEGQLTRTGELNTFNRGYELISKKANVPIIPMYINNIWGSIFSYKYNKFFFKYPKSIPYPLYLTIGKPIMSSKESHSQIMSWFHKHITFYKNFNN